MEWKRGGARYIDSTNNKAFAATKKLEYFNNAVFKLVQNLLFVFSKTLFHRYRYQREQFDISTIDMYNAIGQVGHYDNLGIYSPKDSQTEIIKLDFVFDDKAFLTCVGEQPDMAVIHKKFVKSFKKWLVQYAQFLDQVVKNVADMNGKDKVANRTAYLVHRSHVKALLQMFDANGAFVAPIDTDHKNKTFVYLDGFIMEGKTERIAYYNKMFEGNVMCFSEQSDWWRIDLLFHDCAPKPFLSFNRALMMPSTVEFLYSLGTFFKSDKKIMVCDRSLFSSAIFDGSILLPAFQLFFMNKFCNIKRMEMNLFKKIDYDEFPWPLFVKRQFETNFYQSADKLKLASQEYYSSMQQLLEHFGSGLYPPVYKLMEDLPTFFNSLTLEKKHNF